MGPASGIRKNMIKNDANIVETDFAAAAFYGILDAVNFLEAEG